jgi:hypothetical protein
MNLTVLVVVVLLVLLLGGGGGYYGRRSGWRGPQFGGLFGLIVVILLVLWLTGNLGGPRLRVSSVNQPSIGVVHT